MIGLSIYATLLGLVYASIQLSLLKYWNNMSEWKIPDTYQPSTTVVVIVPARNEADNIQNCLQNILNQNFPKNLLQVILVDDFSTDRTLEFAQNIDDDRLRIIALEELDIQSSDSPKKRALNLGISASEADLIVTTDADCIPANNWLKSLVSYYESEKVDLIAGPVLFSSGESSFEKFQALDFIGMMGITGAGIYSKLFHLCNGANMAFTRSSFEKIGGYKGTTHIASGDDILLGQKYVRDSTLAFGFLKSVDGVVETKPMKSMGDFIQQRLRWGAKSEHYSEKSIIWIQFVVLLTCLSLIAFGLLLLVFFKYHWSKYLAAFMLLLLFKTTSDYISLKRYANFFNRKDLMRSFFSSQILHILYIGFVGLMSVFVRKYEWKGRRLK